MRVELGADVNVEVGVDQIVPEAIIMLQNRDFGRGVGGVVIAEDSLQSVRVVVSGGLLLVQEVVRLVTKIVLRAELIVTVLLVLLARVVNIVYTVVIRLVQHCIMLYLLCQQDSFHWYHHHNTNQWDIFHYTVLHDLYLGHI